MTHRSRYAWRSAQLGHFTDADASCVLDLASTCRTGGWCFGSIFDNWRVDYAPRIRIALGDRYFCDAWWLSAEPTERAPRAA